MKFNHNIVSGLILPLLVAVNRITFSQPLVYNSYTSSIVEKGYVNIDGYNTLLTPNAFITPVSYHLGDSVTDLDNGVYFNLPIGFPFPYNGKTYSTVNVCVNGWVNFTTDPSQTNNPLTLFDTTSPESALAPYFGDHYLRPDTTGGYVQSIISYTNAYNDGTGYGHLNDSAFIIQWENLNINYTRDPIPQQSIGTFQLWLYKNGVIEFHYGAVGAGLVQLGGCSVGIKDQNGASYMNSLFVTESDPIDSVEHSKFLTTVWPPSREPGWAIQFTPVKTNAVMDNRQSLPSVTTLLQNYPDPFSDASEIAFTINGNNANVSLTIYNEFGAAMKTLVNGVLERGTYIAQVNAADLLTGVYYYILRTGDTVAVRKMVVTK